MKANINKGIMTDTFDFTASDPFMVETAQIASAIPSWMQDVKAGPVVGQSVHGTHGADVLYGTERADFIEGLRGNDALYGGGGNDYLSGGGDQDLLHGGAGADVLDGGEGIDTASYRGSAAVMVNLNAGGVGGDAQGDTYIDIENVIGSDFDDTIIGTDLGNRLEGGAGIDHLFGGEGGDTLIGGGGNDVLSGGAGQDFFVFTKGSGKDIIVDFEQGLDKIDITAFGFGGHGNNIFGSDGLLATGWIDPDGFHFAQRLDEDDRVFFDSSSNTLYECRFFGGDSTLIDSSPDVLFLGAAILQVDSQTIHSLHTGDFLIAM